MEEEKETTKKEPDASEPPKPQAQGKKYIEFRVFRSRGYSGKRSDQGWISEVYGVGEEGQPIGHSVKPDAMDWGDSELYRKYKGEWEAVYHLGRGFYKIHPGGGEEDYCVVVYPHPSGTGLAWRTLSPERAEKMARLVAEGVSVEEARLRTREKKPQPSETPAITQNPTLKERSEIVLALLIYMEKNGLKKLKAATHKAIGKWREDGVPESRIYSAINLLDDYTRDKKIFYTFKFRDAYRTSNDELKEEYRTKIESFRELCGMIFGIGIGSEKFTYVQTDAEIGRDTPAKEYYTNVDKPLQRTYEGVRINLSWVNPALIEDQPQSTQPPSETPEVGTKCKEGQRTKLMKLCPNLERMNQNMGHKWEVGMDVYIEKIWKDEEGVWAVIKNDYGNGALVPATILACHTETPAQTPDSQEVSGIENGDLVVHKVEVLNEEMVILAKEIRPNSVIIGWNAQKTLDEGPTPLTYDTVVDPKPIIRFLRDSKGIKIKMGSKVHITSPKPVPYTYKVVGFFGAYKPLNTDDYVIIECIDNATVPKYEAVPTHRLTVITGEEKPGEKPAGAEETPKPPEEKPPEEKPPEEKPSEEESPSGTPGVGTKCQEGQRTKLIRLSPDLEMMNQNSVHEWKVNRDVYIKKIWKDEVGVWAMIEDGHGYSATVPIIILACHTETPFQTPGSQAISGIETNDLVVYKSNELNREAIVLVQKIWPDAIMVGMNMQLGERPVPIAINVVGYPKLVSRILKDNKGTKIKLGSEVYITSPEPVPHKYKVVGFSGANKPLNTEDYVILECIDNATVPKYEVVPTHGLTVITGEEKPEEKPAEAEETPKPPEEKPPEEKPPEEKPPEGKPLEPEVPKDFINKVKSVNEALMRYFKFPEPMDLQIFVSTWFMRNGSCVLKGSPGTGKTVLLQLSSMCMGGMKWREQEGINRLEKLLDYFTANDIFATTTHNADKEPEDVFFYTDISIEKETITGERPTEKSTYIFRPRPRPIVTSFIKLQNECNRIGPNCADALLSLLAERRVEYKGQFFYSPNPARKWWGHLNFFDYNPHLDTEGYELDRALLDRIDVGIYLSGGGLNIRYGVLKRKNEAAMDIPEIFFNAIKEGEISVLSPEEICEIWRIVNKIYVDDETLRWIAFLTNLPNITIRKYNPQSYFVIEDGKPVPINAHIDTTVISYKGVKSNMPTFTPTAQPTASRVDPYATLDSLDRPLGARSAISMLNLIRATTFYNYCINNGPLYFVINDSNRVSQVLKILYMLPYVLDHRVNIGVGKDIQTNFLNFAHYIKYYFIPAVVYDEQNPRLEEWVVAMKIIGELRNEDMKKRREEFVNKYADQKRIPPKDVREKIRTDPFFHHLYILAGEHVTFEVEPRKPKPKQAAPKGTVARV